METDLHGNLATTETEVAAGGVELIFTITFDINNTSKYIKYRQDCQVRIKLQIQSFQGYQSFL